VRAYGFTGAFFIVYIFKMAKDKKSFILYVDQKDLFNKLPDEIAGRLIKHIYAYVSDENPKAEDLIVDIAFEPIKQQLKRDLKSFENVKTKRSEAGKIGASKRWQEMASDANACDGIANDGKRINAMAKIAVNDNDNDNDNVIDNNINYQALLDFVNETFGRKFKVITEKVKKSYKARLKEGYRKEDIFEAIKNCKNVKYHIENNYQYCTPEFFSRSETLDKYADRTIVTESDAIVAHLRAYANASKTR
jgi:uncharacterized phage protein (TIGR02220 family)